MLRPEHYRVGFFLFVMLLAPFLTGTGVAQMTSVSSTSTGTTCTGANDSQGFCGQSTSLLADTGTTLTSRYAWNINADAAAFANTARQSNAEHTISFTATAPGGYRLDISTTRVGEMGRSVDDASCTGTSDISGVLGSSNTALASGSLSLADPGAITAGSTSTYTAINQSSSATIYRLSNGAARSHTLTFRWGGSTNSDSCEVAVRLGEQNGSTTGCALCEYPGNPVRTQANDGHVVTVTFTSLCGNGTVDGAVAEQCDLGASNGTAGSCCTSACLFASPAQNCRTAAGPCDVAETCTGASATCPADAKSTSSCRAAAGPCDPPEFCDGVSNTCPADARSTAECRASAGPCDAAESCDGVNNTCPADSLLPGGTGCRPAAGVCDVAESCDGVGPSCPADAFATGGECRSAVGPCDVSESCSGAGVDCPSDDFAAAGTECRAAAAECDVAESCDGASAGCPIDAVADESFVCRAPVGPCDSAETCDGAGTTCPADEAVADGTSCADLLFCNGAETCVGGSCAGGSSPCEELCDEDADVCTAAPPCAAEPLDGCLVAGKSSLLVKQGSDPAKRLLKWKWGSGAAFDKVSLGDPLSTTDYALCVYGTDASAPSLAQTLFVAPGPLWSDEEDKGFAYDDRDAAAGMRKLTLRPGTDGKSMIKALAKGANVPAITPASAEALLSVDPLAIVQLVSADGSCWESAWSVEQTKKLTDEMFKGVAP